MNFLDITTIAVIGLLLHTGLGLVMLHTYRNRKTYPGFLAWTVAQLLWVAGNALFYFRPVVGEAFSILLSNPMLLLCALMVRNGTAQFYGYDDRKLPHLLNMVVGAAGVVLIYWFKFASPDMTARIAASSLSIGFVILSASIEPFLLSRRRYSMQRMLSVALGLLAASAFARGAAYLSGAVTGDEIGHDGFLKILLLLSMFVMVLEVYGFISLTHERIERELGEMSMRLEELAHTDELTGLPNRRHMIRTAQHDIRLAKRYHHPLSLIIFDLDYFKDINDKHGHAAGDSVLSSVAGRCQTVLRDTDTLARWGGEEFAVLMPETTLAEALHIAGRLRELLGGTPLAGDTIGIVTASFGVAQLGEETFEELTARADVALYQAKHEGRDRVCVAHLVDV